MSDSDSRPAVAAAPEQPLTLDRVREGVLELRREICDAVHRLEQMRRGSDRVVSWLTLLADPPAPSAPAERPDSGARDPEAVWDHAEHAASLVPDYVYAERSQAKSVNAAPSRLSEQEADALLPAPASPGGQPDRQTREREFSTLLDTYDVARHGSDEGTYTLARGALFDYALNSSPAPSPAPSVERQALARIVDAVDSESMADVMAAINAGRSVLAAARPLAEGQPAPTRARVCDRCGKPIVTDLASWMVESDDELEDICQCPPLAEGQP